MCDIYLGRPRIASMFVENCIWITLQQIGANMGDISSVLLATYRWQLTLHIMKLNWISGEYEECIL
jgi:hypothetical protein